MTGQGVRTRVGVWEHRAGADRYERTDGAWYNWSDVTGFARKPDRPRVLLLGESVARGLFYEPFVTPARLIQECLTAASSAAVEVVDLANSGVRMDGLLDTAEEARGLAPDAVIVFAGNNWKYQLTEWVPRQVRAAEARALSAGGVHGLLRHRETMLGDAVSDFVRRMCELFANAAPVMFVIPESNLKDWYPATLTPVLGDGRDMRRHRLMRQIGAMAEAADWAGVLDGCTAVHALDGGISDEAHRFQARAHLALGDVPAALADFRRARDVRLWVDGVDPSWLPSAGAAATRSAAADCGAGVVDLTVALPRYARSGISDRSVFADFCHLNGRGLLAAAKEISCGTGPLLDLAVTEDACDRVLRAPDRLVEAGAAFCASFVSADFAQPEETLRHQARTAAEADPDIVPAMVAYCKAPPSPVPWWMRPIELAAFPNAERYMRGFGRGRYLYDHLLVTAFDAQVRAMSGERERPGAPRGSMVVAPGRHVDLLDPLFAPAWRPLDWDGLIGTLPGRPTGFRHYFRAHTERSRFLFEMAGPAAIEIRATMRLGTPGAGEAVLSLNDRVIESVPLAKDWRLYRTQIPADQVNAGCNELAIHWARSELLPVPLPVLASRLEEGLGQELSVTFGEVHTLRVAVLPLFLSQRKR